MGCAFSTGAVVVVSEQSQRVLRRYGVTDRVAGLLTRFFARVDSSGEGRISVSQYASALRVSSSPELLLMCGMRPASAPDSNAVWLDEAEFMDRTAHFCCLEGRALDDFCFLIYDVEGRGRVAKADLLHQLNVMKDLGHMGVPEVRAAIMEDPAPSFSRRHLHKFSKSHPLLYYPGQRLQARVRREFGGDTWWRKHAQKQHIRRYSAAESNVTAASTAAGGAASPRGGSRPGSRRPSGSLVASDSRTSVGSGGGGGGGSPGSSSPASLGSPGGSAADLLPRRRRPSVCVIEEESVSTAGGAAVMASSGAAALPGVPSSPGPLPRAVQQRRRARSPSVISAVSASRRHRRSVSSSAGDSVRRQSGPRNQSRRYDAEPAGDARDDVYGEPRDEGPGIASRRRHRRSSSATMRAASDAGNPGPPVSASNRRRSRRVAPSDDGDDGAGAAYKVPPSRSSVTDDDGVRVNRRRSSDFRAMARAGLGKS